MEKLKQTFSNFYVDSSNKYAYEFLKNITDRENDYSIVILSGKNGVGKTHLMFALEENLKKCKKNRRRGGNFKIFSSLIG